MKAKIAAVILGLMILGGGVFLALRNPPQSESDDLAVQMADNDSVKDKFADLLRQDKNLECTFVQNSETYQTSGTVYMTGHGERVRGDFVSNAMDGDSETHMIRVDGWSYLWGATMPQGIKVQITEEDAEHLFQNSNGDNEIADDVDFDCDVWRVDDSKFTVPDDVEFIDASAQLQQIEANMPDLGEVKCSACDAIPDEAAKAQCLQALGC
jgi:hypothetical protein